MSILNKQLKFNLLSFFLLVYIVFLNTVIAQDVTTITTANEDISDNLDLEAVATVFGESKDLEDFEKRLNDPKTKISNLDLNGDGDYIRLMETSTEIDINNI